MANGDDKWLQTWRHEIEGRIAKLETSTAVDEERYRNLTRRLDAIDGHLSWIIKILIGGVVGALVTFIVKGGLII